MISYAITDPSTLDFNHLERDLKRFSQKASMIVYRDKSNASKHAVDFVKAAKVFDFEKIIFGVPGLFTSTQKGDDIGIVVIDYVVFNLPSSKTVLMKLYFTYKLLLDMV